ncbi:MAG: glycosyltransferase family 4 protein [Candidatus Promineifilaceae bacterium]
MLIGIDASRAVSNQPTGVEAYAARLIGALLPPALERGHAVRLYFNQAPAAGLFPGANEVVIPFPRLWTHLRLAAELARRPPAVFFTPAHVIPLSYHRPSVATVHDLGFHFFPQAHPARQRLYLRWSTGHNARRAALLMADSQATAHDLARLYPASAGRVRVVYPGFEADLGPVEEPGRLARVQARYGLQPPYLLYIGTLQPRKNLVRLVQAFAASGLAEHQLVLAGKPGWLTAELQAALAKLEPGIRGRIHLPGFVDPAEKAALLSGAAALLYPSLYEGFGFPILEANACGTAVLAADASSLPEVADGAALLVNPLDVDALCEGIVQIVTDHGLRQELIVAGRQNVARFSWRRAAAEALAVLEEAAEWRP